VLEFSVTLSFASGGPITLQLPVPRRGVAFVDRLGLRLPNGTERAVQDLSGIRVVADDGRLVSAELRARPRLSLGFVAPIGQSLSLATLGPDCRALLAETSDNDAAIVLEGDGARLVIKRYAFELSRRLDGSLGGDIGALHLPNDATLTVVAHSLADPRQGERVLWSGPPRDLADACLRSPDPSVPWLCWVEHAGRTVSRPALLTPAGVSGSNDAFAHCAFLPAMAHRKEAMAIHLDNIAASPSHMDWAKLRAALKLCQGRIPLASLDWFTVLARSPQALAALLIGSPADTIARILDMEQELPFLWETIPATNWIGAAEAQRASLATMLGESGREIVAGLMADVLAALQRERPHFAGLVHLLGHCVGATVRAGARSDYGDSVQELLRRNTDRQWPQLPSVLAALPQRSPSPRLGHTRNATGAASCRCAYISCIVLRRAFGFAPIRPVPAAPATLSMIPTGPGAM
jgi:hypothetical protein